MDKKEKRGIRPILSFQIEKFFVHAFFIMLDYLAHVPSEEDMYKLGNKIYESLETGYSYWLRTSPYARSERFIDIERKLNAFKKGFSEN